MKLTWTISRLMLGLAIIAAPAAAQVEWNGYTAQTSEDIYVAFRYDYADEWGLSLGQGVPKSYVELAQDPAQIGVDAQGNPVYEYILVHWVQRKTGFSQIQFIKGFDNSQIVNQWDMTDPANFHPDQLDGDPSTSNTYLPGDTVPGDWANADWTQAPMQWIGLGSDFTENFAQPADWDGNWLANPDVPWGETLPGSANLKHAYWSAGFGEIVAGPLVDAGQQYESSYWNGTAPEDLIYFFNAASGGGVSCDSPGMWWLTRVVTTQLCKGGDITWSLDTPGHGDAPVLGDWGAIPEPATMSLLAVGVVALLRKRRR